MYDIITLVAMITTIIVMHAWKEDGLNGRRLTQIIAILIIAVIVIGIYAIKNGGKEELQGAIDTSRGIAQEGIVPLEISSFTPEMITGSDKPMLIVLGESWCQPCLRMMDDLRALHRGQDDVEVRYIDLGETPAALEYFPVRVTPTILFFLPEGRPFMPPEDFPISMILYSSRDTGEHVFTVHEGYLPRTDLDTLVEALRDA